MAPNTPIYIIAKELNIDSNRIILACKSNWHCMQKEQQKDLIKMRLEKVKYYFETGKNVSEEIVEINKNDSKTKTQKSKNKKRNKINYFPNRLNS